MGVLYDYFRAPDADVAAGVVDRLGGPLTVGGNGEPRFDGVDAKWIDPSVVLGQLVAMVLGVPWSPEIVSMTSLWPPEEGKPRSLEEYNALPEDSPWHGDLFVAELATDVRDSLATVDDSRVPELAAAWVRIEGFAAFTDVDVDWAVSLISELVGLATRAREAGEQLYCWSSL